jgi:hypothetical protein
MSSILYKIKIYINYLNLKLSINKVEVSIKDSYKNNFFIFQDYLR